MLWYSNAFAKLSGGKPASSAWGEDLVDQSLATSLYRADWGNVGDDELAYLLPSLCRRRTVRTAVAGEAQSGPVDYLTRTLIARAEATARKIAQSLDRADAASISRIIEHFAASGLLTSIATHEFSGLADAAGDPGSDTGPASLRTSRPADATTVPRWLIAELTGIAYADRMLSDASEGLPQKSMHAAPLIEWPLSLADVVAATVTTRLNGAYVYDAYDSAHEMLSLAAVIGHLIQGRTVCLPPFLARTLIDILSGRRRAADDEAVSVLCTYADLAGGAKYLVGRAQIVAALGVARRISPRPAVVARDDSQWNARLLKRMNERHCWPIPRAV